MVTLQRRKKRKEEGKFESQSLVHVDFSLHASLPFYVVGLPLAMRFPCGYKSGVEQVIVEFDINWDSGWTK